MKNFTKKSLFLIISIFLGLNIILNAQTNISGLISNNTTWNIAGSPYILTGNVLVDSGFTLTIDPGVIIKFNQLKTLQVGGILHAVGTINNPITFTSNQSIPAPGDWGFILFNQQSTAYDSTLKTGCIMKYCIVEYAGNQNVTNCNAAIRLINAFPLIKYCSILNNAVSGINYRDVTSPSNNGIIKILHCNINSNTSQTGGGAIDIITNLATVTIKIDSNIINNNYSSVNGGGINCNINSGNISNNIITNNKTRGSGGGIYANSGNGVSLVISNNIIKNNTATNSNSFGGGIYASGTCCSGSTIINNNTILGNNAPNGSGGGIYTDYYANCYAAYNLLYNNSAASGGGMINKWYSADVNNNLFVGNTTTSSGNSILTIGAGSFSNNTVIDNNSITQIINENFDITSSTYMNHNTIARNNFQSLFSQRETIYLYTTQGCGGCNPTINFSNNNFNNKTTAYEIFDDNTAVYNTNAKNCWWGKTSGTAIDSVIWDYFDDASLGIVNYIPVQTTPDTTAPVTPPVNVVKTDLGGGNIQLTWNANHETDLAGYKVFFSATLLMLEMIQPILFRVYLLPIRLLLLLMIKFII